MFLFICLYHQILLSLKTLGISLTFFPPYDISFIIQCRLEDNFVELMGASWFGWLLVISNMEIVKKYMLLYLFALDEIGP